MAFSPWHLFGFAQSFYGDITIYVEGKDTNVKIKGEHREKLGNQKSGKKLVKKTKVSGRVDYSSPLLA
jgi:hypothetical protein